MAEKREPKDWITVNGRHIPLFDGESKEDAIRRATNSIINRNEDDKEKQIQKNKEQADKLNGKTEEANIEKSTIESFDIKDLGELKDADNEDAFIDANLKNPKFMQFGRERGMDACRQLWYETRRQRELKNIKEIPIEEAVSTVRENIKNSHISGWFRNGDSGYKPRIAEEMFGNKGTYNAALNIAYHNYKWQMKIEEKQALPFKDWLTTPQTVYRGESGQKAIKDDVFTSYTPSKKIAENFSKGVGSAAGSHHGGESKILSMKIRPIDTWGQLQTNGEYEFMIPLTIDEKSESLRKK